jgi:hypothetical protein
MVALSKSCRTGTLRPNSRLTREITCVARSECPPIAKKSSWIPMGLTSGSESDDQRADQGTLAEVEGTPGFLGGGTLSFDLTAVRGQCREIESP